MRWFRRKKSAEEAPDQAASAPPPAPAAGSAEGAPATEGAEAKPARRRRGTRGGRGRKKASETSAEAGAKTEEKPKKAPERKPAERKAAEKRPAERERKPRARRERKPVKRAPLPDVAKEILVSVEVGEQRVAVIEDGKPAEVYLERIGRRSIAGNVYKGIVDNVLPGMEASFVDIGLEKNGFLYVDEIVVPELEGKRHGKRIHELIDRGQQVLVQAVKDPMGTKGARLTTEVSLPGRFLVYVPYGDGIGISRRLEDAERERLKAISKDLELPTGGMIVRTAAEGASQEELEGDLAFLRKLWATIQGRAERAEAPSLVYQEAELPLRIVRDLFIRDVRRVVVDHERTHRRIVAYLKRTSPDLAERVELYTGKEPLMEKSGVEEEVRSTLNRRVDLPSGGYLIFDYAEAFTVVDVNTGRFVGARGKASGARLEDTITKNNLEAVSEVVRQLRLRDIGGIIVIDFIDMANPKNRALVEDALQQELERDRTKTYVVEISPLGLVEMTRQNVTDGPREILSVACPTCHGDGIVVSFDTHAIEAERRLRRLVASSRSEAFRVELNPRVAWILTGSDGARLNELEEETGRRFVLETSDEYGPTHFSVRSKGPAARIVTGKPPVEPGQELEVKLEQVHQYDVNDAVAQLDGYEIAVANGGPKVGKTVKIRVGRATRNGGYALLLDGAKPPEPPIDPGREVEEDTAFVPREVAAAPAAEPESEGEREGEAPEEDAAAEEKPKKRTRRGSRGGRGRKKPAAAAAANGDAPPAEGAADAPAAEAAPAAGNGRADGEGDPPVEEGTETPADGAAEGEEKPKRKTRRGSRGGRGRRKKPSETAVDGASAAADADAPGEETLAADGASAPAEDAVPTVAGEEDRG